MSGSHRPSSSQALYFVAAAVQQQLHSEVREDQYMLIMRVLTKICVCVVCAMGVCVGVCGSVGSFVCWHLTFFSFFLFALFIACCCRIMLSVSHRASSSRGLYFVAATVQQRSHSKFMWTTSMLVLAMHMRV